MKILEALLPAGIDSESVARQSREAGTLIIGVDRSFKPCTIASAALHAMELIELGVMRVKNRPLAVLMILYGARQISELVEMLHRIDRVIGIDVDPRIFEQALGSLIGLAWEGAECRVGCDPEDLASVASTAAFML